LYLAFLFGLGSVPLSSPNEGLYAECGREMMETGQYDSELGVVRAVVVLRGMLIMLAAVLLAMVLDLNGRRAAALWVVVLGMLLVKPITLQDIAPLEGYVSEKGAAQSVTRALTRLPERPLIVLLDRLENHSTFLFYLPKEVRPILIAEGRWGDLWYGSHFEGKERLFISRQEARRLAAEGRVLYCLAPELVEPDLTMLSNHTSLAVVAGGRLLSRLLPSARAEPSPAR
jgi:4-amino-4-deoxy-L-arabinose transferase-like glycosyltransferase